MISVIVPAYNAEKTIKKCINSILNQTYNDLEVIVINDGSVDDTEKVVKTLQEQDCRVKLITIPNGGVSHARNVGIDNASGDYITFVDSDDYIDIGMYECLINIIRKYNVKIAHCSYKNVDEKENIISVVGDTGNITELNHDEAMSCLLSGRLFAGGLWNKIYASELFSSIRLDENIKYNEDVLANFYLFDRVEKSVFVDRAFYNYVACETSSTHSGNSLIHSEQSLFVSKEMQFLSRGRSYEQYAKNRVAMSLLSLYRSYIFAKQINKQEKKEVMSEILVYKSQGFYSSTKEKVLLFLYRFFPIIFKAFFGLYDKLRVKKLDPEQ